MGIFDSIMKKLGFGDDVQSTETNVNHEVTEEAPVIENAVSEAVEVEEGVTPLSQVDVVAKLEILSETNPGLNWKTSIVDLLKLLDIDSSYAHRKELAEEVGIEGYEGTAEQNILLHKTVLKKLAQNGGNIPSELL